MAAVQNSSGDLPDELWLTVAGLLAVEPRDEDTYIHLRRFARTSRRIRNLARATFQRMTIRCVPLCHTHTLFRTLLEYPVWAQKTKALEVTNYGHRRKYSYPNNDEEYIARTK
jgi:hypothetical protein